jgi:hypothetical protein
MRMRLRHARLWCKWINWQWLSVVLVSACSFDRQPLFEPVNGDAGILTPVTAGTGTAGKPIGSGGQSGGGSGTVVYGDASVDIDSETPGDAATPGDAGAPTCQPGSVMSCSGGVAMTCNASGETYDSVPCGTPGCASDGTRCNACQPAQTSCRGTELVACGADGRVARTETCSLGCGAAGGGTPACFACMPGNAMCSDANSLRLCGADGQWAISACTQGCDTDLNQCSDGRLVPTNLPDDVCLATNTDDYDITTDSELDSDKGCWQVIPQGDGMPDICVFEVGKLQVREGITLRIKGSRAVALVATKDAKIDGVVSVSAVGVTAGPGVARSGAGTGGTATSGTVSQTLLDNAAGGGGGHGTPGAAGGTAMLTCSGGNCTLTGGAGGGTYSNQQIVPLQGGSSGGLNSVVNTTPKDAAGGGGGALQLIACRSLTLGANSVIEANGGGGSGGTFVQATGSGMGAGARGDTLGGGAGGGSGGAILIQARALSVKDGAIIVANGGGGGSGAGIDGNTRANGMPGADGQRSTKAAAGGRAVADSLPGGAGGAVEAPVAGGASTRLAEAAGGGGGAVGRIRIETGSGTAVLDGGVVSPTATIGRTEFR